jgi:stage II sporulation protein D
MPILRHSDTRPRMVAARVTLMLPLMFIALLTLAPARAGAQGEELIRVAVARGRSSIALSSSGGFTVTDAATGQTVGRAEAGQTWQFSSSPLGIAVTSASGKPLPEPGILNGPILIAPTSPQPSPPGSDPTERFLSSNGTRYRGVLRIQKESEQALTLVNVLPLEQYLYGVLPREMPAGWHPEALRAQAVAARTYALYVKVSEKYGRLGFDLLATDESQVYGGVGAEDPRGTAAVDATRGQVILFEGKVIGAFFHSASGGHTENSEIVWSLSLPYIRGVPDFDQDSPKYNWQAGFLMSDVAVALAAKGVNVGDIYGLSRAGQEGVSGRWSAVRVTGAAGSVEMRSEDFRRALGLNSTLFELRNVDPQVVAVAVPLPAGGALTVVGANGASVTTKSGAAYAVGADGALFRPDGLAATVLRSVPAKLEVTGRGWGHGLGLSQYGANALAVKGKTYREILEYYYRGVKVGTPPVAP